MKTCPNCGHELPPDERQKKAGKARWKNTAKAQRSEIARKVVQARWAKKKQGG